MASLRKRLRSVKPAYAVHYRTGEGVVHAAAKFFRTPAGADRFARRLGASPSVKAVRVRLVCPECRGPLLCFQGEHYCPDCLRFELA